MLRNFKVRACKSLECNINYHPVSTKFIKNYRKFIYVYIIRSKSESQCVPMSITIINFVKISADIFYRVLQNNVLEVLVYEVLSLIPRHLRETVALIIMFGIIEKPDINISVVERGIYDPIKLYE